MVNNPVTLSDLRQLIADLEHAQTSFGPCKADCWSDVRHRAYEQARLDLLAARLVTNAMRYHTQLKLEWQAGSGNASPRMM